MIPKLQVPMSPKWIKDRVWWRTQAMCRRFGLLVHGETDECTILRSLIAHRARNTDRLSFVQIGANDGVSFDGLYELVRRFDMQGLVVEPIPDYFSILQQNYAHLPSVTPVNVALHADRSTMTIYRVDPRRVDVSHLATGIASFDPDHHLRTGIPSNCIIEETVPCLTLQQLFDQHEIKSLDLLQIDTEGYDFEVLKMLAKSHVRPAIVKFEHGLKRGVMTRDQLKQCLDRFYDSGYYIVMEHSDAIAFDSDLV
jgi:FkbM family methyltransferase